MTYPIGSPSPVGTMIQASVQPADASYIPANEGVYLRTAYPALAALFPIGEPVSTIRTLNHPPGSWDSGFYFGYAANSSCSIVATFDNGTNGYIEYSINGGATWTATIAPGATRYSAQSAIWANTRWFVNNAGDGIVYVNPNSTPSTGWVACTVAAGITGPHSFAYSPSLDRLVACPSGGGTGGVYYISGSAGTAFTACTIPATASYNGICWTGSVFIISTQEAGFNTIWTSTDGITFVRSYVWRQIYNAAPAGIVSDGNGTVLMWYKTSSTYSVLLVSKDHGANWTMVRNPSFSFAAVGGDALGNITDVSCVNGRFIVGFSSRSYFAASADGMNWQTFAVMQTGIPYTAVDGRISYSNGVYFAYLYNTATMVTFTEDSTKFRVPRPAGTSDYPYFIKATP